MSPAVEQVLQSALSLPKEERLELLEALLAVWGPDLGRPFADAWLAEVQRRSAEIDAGTAVLTPWPEVKRRVREKFRGQADG